MSIHVIAKPIGPACNLNCAYCFYLEKEKLFPANEDSRMSDEILSTFIRQYIEAQPESEVEFVWQGGEPTLLGIDFFRKVLELQKPYRKEKKIRNCLQTNGVLLNDEWCKFLKQNQFLVGISLDGPKEVHDLYRLDRTGKGTFDRVLNGLRLLKKHAVEFNLLACVARETAQKPHAVYQFLREEGVEFIQFTPVVERDPTGKVTPWTVAPESYGDFLIHIFDDWIKQDVGKIFVMNFDWALNAWVFHQSPICIFSESCGRSLVIEHNGDVYACDHYVYPDHRLGNILNHHLKDLVELPEQKKFGAAKKQNLTASCKACKYLIACRGECPKRRFGRTPYGGPGQNYLCAGYKKYFRHITPYLNIMRKLLEQGRPVSDIMQAEVK